MLHLITYYTAQCHFLCMAIFLALLYVILEVFW